MPRVHLWVPSVRASEGGIESYSCALAKTLAAILPHEDLVVLARNDKPPEVRAILGNETAFATAGQLPRPLWLAAFASLVLVRALRDRPDLVITTHLNFAPFALSVRRLTRIPFWVVLHGYEAWEIERPSQRRAVRAADLLLPVSRVTCEKARSNYAIPAERFHLLPDTFDPARLTPGPKSTDLLRRLGLSAENRIILTVGRLSPMERYKGQDRMIRALPRILEKVPTAKYLIVGGGDDRARLERIAREEKVADAVIFAGRVGHEELPEYYRLCDLYAMPSIGEGFGIVFLEALATGKPVLGGNRDGAVDALNGGELGVLVDPENEEAIAEATTAVLLQTHSHPLLNQPERLRARTMELFGPERFNQHVKQLLTENAP